MAALLEFESGAVASLVYSAYDRFDSDELAFWIGEGGAEKKAHVHGASRAAARRLWRKKRYVRKWRAAWADVACARPRAPRTSRTSGSCSSAASAADLRLFGRPASSSTTNLRSKRRGFPLPPGRAFPNKDGVADELYDAVTRGVAPLHDGRWGMATVAAMLALIASARERREVSLSPEVVHG